MWPDGWIILTYLFGRLQQWNFPIMGQSRPFFVYFRPFLSPITIRVSISTLWIEKACWGFEPGAHNTTELWRPPTKMKIKTTFYKSRFKILLLMTRNSELDSRNSRDRCHMFGCIISWQFCLTACFMNQTSSAQRLSRKDFFTIRLFLCKSPWRILFN